MKNIKEEENQNLLAAEYVKKQWPIIKVPTSLGKTLEEINTKKGNLFSLTGSHFKKLAWCYELDASQQGQAWGKKKNLNQFHSIF